MENIETIVTIVIIALAVFILIKIFTAPIKLIFKLVLNTISGFLMLFIVNLVGSAFGFSIETSIINCLLSGLFGIPGVLLLILINIIA